MNRLLLVAFGALLLATGLSGQSSIRSWGMLAYDTECNEGGVVFVDAESYLTVALRTDGRVFMNGNALMRSMPPMKMPPAGRRYTNVSMSDYGAVGLLDDGSIESWGEFAGFPPSPALPPAPTPPPGLRYSDVKIGNGHALALRSDGLPVDGGPTQPANATCRASP